MPEKYEVVIKYKQSMASNSWSLRNAKIELIIRIPYKMAIQLMISNKENINNCTIHMKQYLNKLNEINKLVKYITNDNSNKSI